MKKYYSEKEISEILGKEQVLSARVEEKIQETYELLGLKKRKTAGRWRRNFAAGCAAACAVAFLGVTAAHPAWAEELFSKAFQMLIGDAAGTKYEKEDTVLYEQVAKNAEAPGEIGAEKENAAEAQSSEEISGEKLPLSVTDQGVTLSVSDVYCDGYILYYTLNMSTEREGLRNADFIYSDVKNAAESGLMLRNIGQTENLPVDFSFRMDEDGNGAAMCKADLWYMREEMGLEIPLEGSLEAELSISQLTGCLADEWEETAGENGEYNYKATDRVEGSWKLGFSAEIDTSQNKTWDLGTEENGIVLKSITRTGANLIVELECPDFTKEPYLDPYNDPAVSLYDSNGELLPWSMAHSENHGDNTSVQKFICQYSEDTSLYLQVTNKNVDDSVLAEFEIVLE